MTEQLARQIESSGWARWLLLALAAAAFLAFLFANNSDVARSSDEASSGTTFKEIIGSGSNVFVMVPDPSTTAEQWLELARGHCGSRPQCSVMAWPSAAQAPSNFPYSPEQEEAMMFGFSRDFGRREDMAQWDCRRFKREDPEQCLPHLRPVR